jgi:hypothetical protein
MSGSAIHSNSVQTQKKFGKEPDSLALKVEIQDLLKTPEGYLEKTVIIQGRVREECPGGHWFVLENPKDTSSTIFVDLTKAGFVVPQMIGAGALVYGRFAIQDDNPNIAGLGVAFEDRAHAPSGHSSVVFPTFFDIKLLIILSGVEKYFNKHRWDSGERNVKVFRKHYTRHESGSAALKGEGSWASSTKTLDKKPPNGYNAS